MPAVIIPGNTAYTAGFRAVKWRHSNGEMPHRFSSSPGMICCIKLQFHLRMGRVSSPDRRAAPGECMADSRMSNVTSNGMKKLGSEGGVAAFGVLSCFVSSA